MCYHIPDSALRNAGVSEGEARLELACRFFDIGKLDVAAACELAGLDRDSFEAALRERKIAVVRPTVADFEQDLRTLQSWGDAA
ncbi:MAG: UPF0175 family protein [Phycisphaerae bacterium]|nr:UPF0175 family protein [Phycisphaerae bacterium]